MSTISITSHNVAAKSKAWQRATFDARLIYLRIAVGFFHPAIHLVQETGDWPYLKKLDATYKQVGLVRAPGGGRWRHIYYDPRKVRLIASGLMALNLTRTKHAAWARFVDKQTGELIYVTSAHLSAGGEEKAQARYKQAEQLLRKSQPHVYGALEIHGGDFNSYNNVGNVVFKPRYYEDARRLSRSSANEPFNTFNGRDTIKPDPSTQKRDSNHLDHFYLKHDRVVSLWSQRVSTFASDHNIIAIKVAL